MQARGLEKAERPAVRAKVRFNTTVTGLPAYWILRWQELGLVRSKSDALRQALIALREKFAALEEGPSEDGGQG